VVAVQALSSLEGQLLVSPPSKKEILVEISSLEMWCSVVAEQGSPAVLEQLLERDLSKLERRRLELAIAIGVACFRQQPELMRLLLEHFQSIPLSWE
jgi:hypothetical protein